MRTASDKHSPPLCVKLPRDALGAHRFMPGVLSPHPVRRTTTAQLCTQPVDTIRTKPEAITAIRPRGWAPASSGAFPPRNRPRKPSQRLSEAPGATGVSGTPISHPSRIHSPHRLAIDPYRCLQKGCPQLLEARQIRRFTASAHEPPKNLTFRREPVMHDI